DAKGGQATAVAEIEVIEVIEVIEPERLPAPKGVRARAKAGGIEVRWKEVPGATRHDLLWSKDERLRRPKRVGGTRTPHLHAEVEVGDSYHYAVVAVGPNGDGERSKIVSAVFEMPNKPPKASFTVEIAEHG